MEVYSLSKSYNMQGFRLGFVVSGVKLMSAYGLVKDNTDNGQFIAIQKAGVEALDGSQSFLAKNSEKYKARLARVSSILREAGLDAAMPGGTFYLYFPVPKNWHGQEFHTAQEFTNFLISKYGIISVPWDEAGPHVRFSMTFEINNKDFADEEAVYKELSSRLCSGSYNRKLCTAIWGSPVRD